MKWSDFFLGILTGLAVLMAVETIGIIEGWW